MPARRASCRCQRSRTRAARRCRAVWSSLARRAGRTIRSRPLAPSGRTPGRGAHPTPRGERSAALVGVLDLLATTHAGCGRQTRGDPASRLDRGLLVCRDDAVARVQQLPFPTPHAYRSRIRPKAEARPAVRYRGLSARIASRTEPLWKATLTLSANAFEGAVLHRDNPVHSLRQRSLGRVSLGTTKISAKHAVHEGQRPQSRGAAYPDEQGDDRWKALNEQTTGGRTLAALAKVGLQPSTVHRSSEPQRGALDGGHPP